MSHATRAGVSVASTEGSEPRTTKVVTAVAHGKTNAEIAGELYLSEATGRPTSLVSSPSWT